MKLQPQELAQEGFVLMDELEHQDLMPFIQRYIKKRTQATILYYVANILMMGLAVGLLIRFAKTGFAEAFAHFAYGVALAFLLIPLHEYVHALAYKSQGAKQTSYDANLRKFYFMAMADQFVANRKEFQIVALAPFMVITLMLTILLFIVPGLWMVTVAGAMLTHTSMCSGDFGLLSYLDVHRDKEMVTYDDKSAGRSYFYGR
ncbi:MAG TPA: DUF3267 domain-containing protein [Chitinophagaceae bacterium]|nr:DUF3267 domain-containing protein [Chitinophagaceae bacterium]